MLKQQIMCVFSSRCVVCISMLGLSMVWFSFSIVWMLWQIMLVSFGGCLEGIVLVLLKKCCFIVIVWVSRNLNLCMLWQFMVLVKWVMLVIEILVFLVSLLMLVLVVVVRLFRIVLVIFCLVRCKVLLCLVMWEMMFNVCVMGRKIQFVGMGG